MNRSRFKGSRWIPWAGILAALCIALAGCHGSGTTRPATEKIPAAPDPVLDKAIAMGIFNQQCAQCHSIGAVGKKDGIPLDHEGSTRTQKWIEVQIRHPEIHNPKTLMPLFPADRISNSEMKSLTRYLVSLI